MYALQKVQIRNTMPLEEAEKHYTSITKKKPRKVRETDNFYQFRYLPPTKFEKRSFRTKVVNDDINLIFGKLKQEHQKLEGKGLFDYFTKGYDYVKNTTFGQSIKNAMSINDFSVKTKANLEKFGDYPINYMQIRRVPISSTLDLVLQGVSLGEWERLKKKYGFDNFFHLSMVVGLRGAKDITLNTGKKMKVAKQLAIEKLEVVSVNENVIAGEGMQTQDVPLAGKSFTINDMFRKARDRVGDATFFAYSALGKNNCQDFIALLLDVEGLYRAEEKAFVYQNISELVAELPAFTKGFAQTVTDLGALVNKATGIGGASPNEQKRGGLPEDEPEPVAARAEAVSRDQLEEILADIILATDEIVPFSPEFLDMLGNTIGDFTDAEIRELIDGFREQLTQLQGGSAPDEDYELLDDDANLPLEEEEDRALVELLINIREQLQRMVDMGVYTPEDFAEQLQILQDIIQEETTYEGLRDVLEQFEIDIEFEMARWEEEEIEAENDPEEDEPMEFESGSESEIGDGKPITLDSLYGGAEPIVIPRKDFIKEHKHLIGMLKETCKEGKDQAKELKEIGGNKASGFIRAVLAKKNEEAEGFEAYNAEGFNVGKLSKITKDVTRRNVPRMEPELQPVDPQGLVRDGVYARTAKNKREGHVYKDTPANRRLGRVGQMKPRFKNLKGTYEVPEVTLQHLANQYYHTEGLANRRKIKQQALTAGFDEADFNRALITERKRVQRARDVEQGVVRQYR